MVNVNILPSVRNPSTPDVFGFQSARAESVRLNNQARRLEIDDFKRRQEFSRRAAPLMAAGKFQEAADLAGQFGFPANAEDLRQKQLAANQVFFTGLSDTARKLKEVQDTNPRAFDELVRRMSPGLSKRFGRTASEIEQFLKTPGALEQLIAEADKARAETEKVQIVSSPALGVGVARATPGGGSSFETLAEPSVSPDAQLRADVDREEIAGRENVARIKQETSQITSGTGTAVSGSPTIAGIQIPEGATIGIPPETELLGPTFDAVDKGTGVFDPALGAAERIPLIAALTGSKRGEEQRRARTIFNELENDVILAFDPKGEGRPSDFSLKLAKRIAPARGFFTSEQAAISDLVQMRDLARNNLQQVLAESVNNTDKVDLRALRRRAAASARLIRKTDLILQSRENALRGSEQFPVPSSRAVEALRQNPELRDQFDEKFGPGASDGVLGSERN